MITETYKAKDGWRWRLKSNNGRIMADSGEAYTTRHGAERAFDRVQAMIGESLIEQAADAVAHEQLTIPAHSDTRVRH